MMLSKSQNWLQLRKNAKLRRLRLKISRHSNSFLCLTSHRNSAHWNREKLLRKNSWIQKGRHSGHEEIENYERIETNYNPEVKPS